MFPDWDDPGDVAELRRDLETDDFNAKYPPTITFTLDGGPLDGWEVQVSRYYFDEGDGDFSVDEWEVDGLISDDGLVPLAPEQWERYRNQITKEADEQ